MPKLSRILSPLTLGCKVSLSFTKKASLRYIFLALLNNVLTCCPQHSNSSSPGSLFHVSSRQSLRPCSSASASIPRLCITKSVGRDDYVAMCTLPFSISYSILLGIGTRYGIGLHAWDLPPELYPSYLKVRPSFFQSEWLKVLIRLTHTYTHPPVDLRLVNHIRDIAPRLPPRDPAPLPAPLRCQYPVSLYHVGRHCLCDLLPFVQFNHSALRL